MKGLAQLVTKSLNILIVVSLSLMAACVFGNVIMRYFFKSGLTWAEELSRLFFMWLIFLGSIVAFKENAHLGVDTVVKYLSVRGRKILYIVNSLLILGTLAMLADGSWELSLLNLNQSTPTLLIPYTYVYISGVVMSFGMGIIVISKVYQLLTNKMTGDDLVMITESEDKEKIDNAISTSKGGETK